MPRDVAIRNRAFAVPVGTPKVVDLLPYGFPLTVSAVPGATGTLLIETSATPGAAGDPGAATWVEWPSGAVSAATQQSLTSPFAALRATAATAAGSLELAG